ncbi:MAG: sulfur carrier protein ThiS [Gammaproteobacteria bacterium]|nr:sulfur carrier protein ThiS [Gammaproteobacteria bacterium]
MQITLNGKSRALRNGSTIADLVQALELVGKRLAVEVNEEVIPRSEHPKCVLNDGDRVEIVHAIGGG